MSDSPGAGWMVPAGILISVEYWPLPAGSNGIGFPLFPSNSNSVPLPMDSRYTSHSQVPQIILANDPVSDHWTLTTTSSRMSKILVGASPGSKASALMLPESTLVGTPASTSNSPAV